MTILEYAQEHNMSEMDVAEIIGIGVDFTDDYTLTEEDLSKLNADSQATEDGQSENVQESGANEETETPAEQPAVTLNSYGETNLANYCEAYGLNRDTVFEDMRKNNLITEEYYEAATKYGGEIGLTKLTKDQVIALNKYYEIDNGTSEKDEENNQSSNSENKTTTSGDNVIGIKYEEFDAARECNKQYKNKLKKKKENLEAFDKKITDDIFCGLAADKSHEIIKLINNAIEIYAEDLMHRMNVFLNKAEEKYKKADQNAANKS